MTVRPTPSGQTPRPNVGRTDRSQAPAPGVPSRPPETSPPVARGSRRDELQISSEARELQQREVVDRGPGGELSAARMKQVLQRLSDGHYDRPEVRDEVLRRLGPDLQ